MNEIHCHICGGSISDPATVSYRLASVPVIPAKVSGAPCSCALAIVYGPPAGYMSWPGLPIPPKGAAQ